MCIFLDDADYRQFVYVLGDVVEDFDIRCWNYCVMPNHYHVTLQPAGSNISEALRRLNSVYAQWWNRRHSRVGHVFQGRFKAQVVDEDTYLLAVSRYVAMNPIRAGLTTRPDEWPWSSYRATAGLSSAPSFLSATSTLRMFGEGPDGTLQQRFVKFIGDAADEAAMDRIRSNELVLGSREFKQRITGSED
jgi:REP element-mobilizing transposase RayT